MDTTTGFWFDDVLSDSAAAQWRSTGDYHVMGSYGQAPDAAAYGQTGMPNYGQPYTPPPGFDTPHTPISYS